MNRVEETPPDKQSRRTGWKFLGVFFGLVLIGHWYIADRLLFDTSLPDASRRLGSALLLVLAASVLTQPFLRGAHGLLPRVQGRVAYFWFGASFLLATCLLALELPSLVVDRLGVLGMAHPDARAVLAIGAFLLVAAYAGWRALGPAPVRRVEVRLPNWPAELDGFRIAQISDLHISPRRGARFVERLVRRTNSVGADLIAITGDVVDGSVPSLGAQAEALGSLRAPEGVYLVTGNHDHYSGADAWCARFSELGIQVLRNRRIRIEPNGDAHFHLAGVDDHRGDWTVGSTCDIEAAVGDRDRDVPLVLLSHNPATFEEAVEHGVELQISGHTHGGQIWPFHAAVRAVTPYVAGLYRERDSALYVSRGTGYWGPPLRLGAPSEITELSL
ncbi:MAG: metallophosphoesterase, partial [Akkermansiaceae bacterium]|nr:metallophosphoesterase [Akkermansiaceae bacterium]